MLDRADRALVGARFGCSIFSATKVTRLRLAGMLVDKVEDGGGQRTPAPEPCLWRANAYNLFLCSAHQCEAGVTSDRHVLTPINWH